MGAKVLPETGRHATNGSFYGNLNSPTLLVRPEGQRTMMGGPLLPRLPKNPFATTARQIARQPGPQLPKNLNGNL